MSLQTITNSGHSKPHKGSGYYLMELRQHVSEENRNRREKLLINDWAAPKINFLPILQRRPGFGPE